ncbi:hypothetical protein ACI65C_004370 [Semiaphis heraclei]
MSQTHLHSSRFDICRICLFEPESNRNVKFVNILTTGIEENWVKKLMSEFLKINVESNDVKPKIICEHCHKSLLASLKIKKKAAESEIIINYLASKKVESNDVKPKIICEHCHKSLLASLKIKKKAAESEIIINYLASKKVESNDVKPKIICEHCHKSLLASLKIKKKAAESEIIINYLASKKFAVNNPGTSVGSTHSTRPNMYVASTSRVSIASTSSPAITNNGESSSIRQSQLILNSGFVDDSDDSCIDVTPPIPSVDLISDYDDSDDDNDNMKHCLKNQANNLASLLAPATALFVPTTAAVRISDSTMSQMHLHSENFDLCRVCLFEPESDRSVKFVNILTTGIGENWVKKLMSEYLKINVESNDVKPKIICEHCYESLLNFLELKKKAAESQIVINYLALKKFAVNNPGTSVGSTHSTRPNMYVASTSRVSIASTSSPAITNNGESSSIRLSQLILNSGFDDDSDDDSDDSCIDVTAPIPSVDLISNDDDSDDDNDNMKHCLKNQANNVESNDVKPKIICEHCHTSLLASLKIKKKAAESEIIINYLASKKAITNNGESSSIRQSQLILNSGFVDDSDDSCIDVTPPIPSVDLISDYDDDDDDDDDNMKHCLKNKQTM